MGSKTLTYIKDQLVSSVKISGKGSEGSQTHNDVEKRRTKYEEYKKTCKKLQDTATRLSITNNLHCDKDVNIDDVITNANINSKTGRARMKRDNKKNKKKPAGIMINIDTQIMGNNSIVNPQTNQEYPPDAVLAVIVEDTLKKSIPRGRMYKAAQKNSLNELKDYFVNGDFSESVLVKSHKDKNELKQQIIQNAVVAVVEAFNKMEINDDAFDNAKKAITAYFQAVYINAKAEPQRRASEPVNATNENAAAAAKME